MVKKFLKGKRWFFALKKGKKREIRWFLLISVIALRNAFELGLALQYS